ncbi:FAD:protein FMN transferase [Maribacter chungangensis]|uniref:FAD:protein FMN transferase n=2 Tax=Maribacter chungangensis TaxID=1069117 RepID=A0ABW3B930_9FLAO
MKTILFFVLGCFCWIANAQQAYKQTVKLMGSRFEITVVAENALDGDKHIAEAIAEIERIEKLISSWDPNSETSKINEAAGKTPVTVSQELFDLIERSLKISKLTDGAFDISYASMDRIWKFDGSMTSMPSKEAIQHSVAKVGFQNIVLDKQHNSVFLRLPGMKIGFGAIGKGYAADKAKEVLTKKGVSSGIINAAGDMNTWGKQPNGTAWKVALTNPMDKNKGFGMLPVTNRAVVTSGNYEKQVVFNGVTYSHIIDPRSGYPATDILSVTVFAPKAELADALATSVFVMGRETGLDRIDQLPQVDCIIIAEDGKVFKSKNIKIDTL